MEQSREYDDISAINEIKEQFHYNLTLMENKLKAYEFEKFEKE